MQEAFSLINKTHGKPPRLPFARLKDAILGTSYTLSVALVTPKESHRLNLAHRAKDKPTNVLSFVYEKNSGELVLDVATAKKDASNFDMPQATFLLYLVIHGMLHLKGYDHGSTMEKEERKWLDQFSP
jgi:probable rRNA maturation factor